MSSNFLKAGCLVFVILTTGCASVSTGANSEVAPRVYSEGRDQVFSAATQAGIDLGWAVTFSDKETGTVVFRAPVSLWTWGDQVSITLSACEEGTRVNLASQTPGQIVAYGKNRRNIERFYEALGQNLKGNAP